MSLDKLAHPDKPEKLGAQADFDDKKPGSPRVTTRVALSGPAGLAALLLVGAMAFGHTSGSASAPSGDTATAAVHTDHDTDEPAASTPSADPAAPQYAANEDQLELARRTPRPEPPNAAPEPKPEPESEPEPAEYVEPEPRPAPPGRDRAGLRAGPLRARPAAPQVAEALEHYAETFG